MDANMMEKVWALFFKPGEAEKYAENEDAYLRETGLDECSHEELVDAISLSFEKGPVNQGATVLGGSQTIAPSAPAIAPPPPPPPSLPPIEAVKHTVNYYVSNSNYSETNVDDRDTNVDSSVNTTVFAEDSEIDFDIDNETNTASGDRAVAGHDLDGVATGDGAVAAGDDISGGVNTGVNSGIITGEDSDLDNTAIGDGNTQVNDSTNVATGSGNVTDIDDSDLEGVNFGEGGSAEHTDIDIDNSDLNNVGFGEGDVTQDNSVDIQDSFNPDVNIDDSFNEHSLLVEDVQIDVEDPEPTEL